MVNIDTSIDLWKCRIEGDLQGSARYFARYVPWKYCEWLCRGKKASVLKCLDSFELNKKLLLLYFLGPLVIFSEQRVPAFLFCTESHRLCSQSCWDGWAMKGILIKNVREAWRNLCSYGGKNILGRWNSKHQDFEWVETCPVCCGHSKGNRTNDLKGEEKQLRSQWFEVEKSGWDWEGPRKATAKNFSFSLSEKETHEQRHDMIWFTF